MKSLDQPEVRVSLLDRVRKLEPGAQRRWGKMNAHQMLCHLNDSFLSVTGQRMTSKRGEFLEHTLIKFIALYAPMEWPHGVQTMPEVDQTIGGTPPAEWQRDRGELLRLIEWFATPAARKGDHPIFGALGHAQWMRWAYLHVDHHLRQFGV